MYFGCYVFHGFLFSNTIFLLQTSTLWQYESWSFQTGGTKLERFLPKNQHTRRKLFNFENWISGDLRSFQKSEFLKSIIFIFSVKKIPQIEIMAKF
jgi:hypothetical protein